MAARRHLTPDIANQFQRLYVIHGRSLREIASQYGVSRPTVRYHLLKLGVKLRAEPRNLRASRGHKKDNEEEKGDAA